MQKNIVYAGLFAFLIASLLGMYYIKDSFKILQVNTHPDWKDMRFQDWHEYSSPTGKFKVLLPTLPQRATENVKDPHSNGVRHYDMYVSEKQNGTTFLVSLISFPSNADVQAQKTLINTFITDMVATNPKNELKELSQVQYKDQEATSFQIVNDQLVVNGIAFTKVDTLYVISTLFKKDNQNKMDWDFFMNSFELTSNPADAASTTVQP